MRFTAILLLVIITLSNQLSAQGVPTNSMDKTLHKSNNGSLKGDSRIGDLNQTMIDNNEKDKKIDGYRIQLFSSSGAESWSRANQVQGEFLKIYPDIPAYVIHIKPSFRVRIGDYRNRMEAERFYVEIKENFPDAFIVRDKINFPVLGIEKEDED